MYYKPLADRIRPKQLSEVVGQQHILGRGKILERIIGTQKIPNMIFYGPSGTGKTTVANIIANVSNRKLFKLNGTSANIDDIKNVISHINTIDAQNGILLYIDELHYLNKKQQQSIIQYIENGDIVLIGSTTENINFSIFNAILSRCMTFEFKEVSTDDIIIGLKRAIKILEDELEASIRCEEMSLRYISEISGGDLRRALNILDVVINTHFVVGASEVNIGIDKIDETSQSKITNYDRDGDGHYNLLSYFQKSIRGSDPQAGIHALAKLVKSGDINSICRRLMVIASEDIGLAYPQAIAIVKACVDSALVLGFPEARIPLAQATILLATAPKSNSAYMAINAAINDLDNVDVGQIPQYLNDTYSNKAINFKEKYLYPHDYPNHYIAQQYLPENIKDTVYYEYGDNKIEQSTKNYWDNIKKRTKA